MPASVDLPFLDDLTHRHGLRVLSGPFAGMPYVSRSAGSAFTPKLLGTYERELHASVEAIIARRPRHVVNIGCGEGYYAVGLALRLPDAEVDAFDTDPVARALCAELARCNRVESRVLVHGICSPGALVALLAPASVIVCDCEGAELDLLTPDRVPALRSFEMLVALHDHARPGCTNEILARFAPTHDARIIPPEDRTPDLLFEVLSTSARS